MKLQLAAFAGEIPRTIPRLLGDSYAQAAINTKLEDGSLTPIRRGRFVTRLDEDAKTIYRHEGGWLSWPEFVHVSQGPVATNRLYVMGEGKPKLFVDGNTYDLAVPRPQSAPAAAISSGENDPLLSATILYAYTWVTEFDEESEPSPLSNELIWTQGMGVTVTGFEAPPVSRAVNRMRIYRSQTSSLGVTQLYFIAERPASAAPFMDDSLSIAEVIPSGDFNPPPDDLTGLIALPNGMMAAFAGKKLYFCEPFIPHAWPEKYVLTCDYDIVGLGAFGTSIAIMTKGMPYIASGTAPENMVMERIELNLPCINAQGIVDLGYSVAYPSHNGLVTVSSGGAVVATQNVMTRDQWLQMNPYSFVAGQFSGRYMASYAYSDVDGIERRGVIILDLSGGQPFLTRSADFADAMYYEIESGALYLLKNDRDIYEWDALSEPFGEQTWLSKRFVLPTYTNFGAILIEGEDATSTEQRAAAAKRNAEIRERNRALLQSGLFGGDVGGNALASIPLGGSLLQPVQDDTPALGVTIIADGREVAYTTTLNEIARLPSGFLAKTWEILVRGNVQVTGIILANTPTDIAEG